ncbi:MAG: YgaP family membrane protein [Bacteroidales bacterium]
MKKKVGVIDKTFRLIISAVVAITIIIGDFPLTLTIIFGIIGLINLIPSFKEYCGLYTVFGINSCTSKEFD